jgi:hypothetical protein
MAVKSGVVPPAQYGADPKHVPALLNVKLPSNVETPVIVISRLYVCDSAAIGPANNASTIVHLAAVFTAPPFRETASPK